MSMRIWCLLLSLSIPACQWFRNSGGAEVAYPASLHIVAAKASLHRLADPDAEDDDLQDIFLLRIACELEVLNQSGKVQDVRTQFGTPFDDLRLRVSDHRGRRLVSTSHTLLMDPLLEPKWTFLDEGLTRVQLVSAAPVLPEPPDDELPFILADHLTKTIQLEFFGGFPGSDLSRAIQSNKVTVEIDDQTIVIPRKTVPVPGDSV